MDWVQLHLALNHLPVVGVPLLTILLLVAWVLKAQQVIRFALWFLLVLAVLAIAIKFTGDFAADATSLELAQARDFVTLHEEAGDQATTAVFFLALAVGASLFVWRGGRASPRWALALVLVLGIVSTLLYARSAHTGGLISHPELREKQ
jgi:hypothetical protein